ncbi:MAG TPA: AraC family transcriptional regulator, partial [Flavobacteriales bacterium]|nr:AraC family transcriptional regulator [Flavobacteriales bacterium]
MSAHLYIRNMVCDRCRRAVTELLVRTGVAFTAVHLGEVDLPEPLTKAQRSALQDGLLELGFELIDDRRTRLIEKVRGTVIGLVRSDAESPLRREKLSVVIAREVGMDYSTLSKLFSEVEGTTIEQFLIAQRVERAKELLVYDELTLGEIAYRLGYSSAQHLSTQFRKVTGLTPSHFKRI